MTKRVKLDHASSSDTSQRPALPELILDWQTRERVVKLISEYSLSVCAGKLVVNDKNQIIKENSQLISNLYNLPIKISDVDVRPGETTVASEQSVTIDKAVNNQPTINNQSTSNNQQTDSNKLVENNKSIRNDQSVEKDKATSDNNHKDRNNQVDKSVKNGKRDRNANQGDKAKTIQNSSISK